MLDKQKVQTGRGLLSKPSDGPLCFKHGCSIGPKLKWFVEDKKFCQKFNINGYKFESVPTKSWVPRCAM